MIRQISYGARGHWWIIQLGLVSKKRTELDGTFEDEEHALEAAREHIAKSRVSPSSEEVDVILVNPDGSGHLALHELLKRSVIV